MTKPTDKTMIVVMPKPCRNCGGDHFTAECPVKPAPEQEDEIEKALTAIFVDGSTVHFKG